MAEDSEKTEDPTGKRMGEAREKGQAGKSREIDHWMMLLAITLAVFMFGPKLGTDLRDELVLFFAQAHAIPVDRGALGPLLQKLAMQTALALAPTVSLLAVAGIGSSLLPHGVIFSPTRPIPSFSTPSSPTALTPPVSFAPISQ